MKNFITTIFYFLLALSFIQISRAANNSCDTKQKDLSAIAAATLKQINLEDLRKIVLVDGETISTSEMRFIDLREDQSIDLILLKDNSVIDRNDILGIFDCNDTFANFNNINNLNKEPREDDRIISDELRIGIPDYLKKELLGIDGGGMTIPEEVLHNHFTKHNLKN